MSGVVLTVEGVSKAYGPKPAVIDADLRLKPGRVTALLGPSGCGKSTLLRLAAGLERPDAGRIALGTRILAAAGTWVPPEARGIGLVFQDYALFPHMTVVENVAYGLRGLSRAERRVRAMDRLAAVRLTDKADAYPHTLSGGQQQRAALARALAPGPAALLLDEPFSGLDAHLKSEVRADLIGVLRSAGAAVLVVTHDAAEAMLMADDLALMAAGRIIQVGAPRHCYLDPVSPEAARLLGEVSLLAAQVANGTAQTAFGPVPAPSHPDGPARVVVRPEGIIVGGAGAPARVAGVAFGGAFHEVDLAADHAGPGASVRARLTGPAPAVGQAVQVTLDPALARVFPATT